jgi:hypothetical protein
MFVATADALTPGTNVPVNTGFAGQGQFRQGMQTGAVGQGQAGGFAGGAANVPGRVGQQQGAGITVGDLPSGPVAPGGGCECITAPCNCAGTGGGLSQGFPNTNQPGTYTGPMVIGGQAGGIPLNPTYWSQSGAVQPAGTGQLGAGQFIRR